ncbi:hypothetical protein ACWNYO_00765 [Candidatus Vidania fulgoroideorum]
MIGEILNFNQKKTIVVGVVKKKYNKIYKKSLLKKKKNFSKFYRFNIKNWR